MYPNQTLWEYNALFQEFPYHFNVNATYNANTIHKESELREIWMGHSIKLAEQVYGDRTQVKEETKKSVVVWD